MSQTSTRELVDELKVHGVKVVVYTCDIGQEEQVTKMISYIQETMPPIRGVLHGAMVNQVSRCPPNCSKLKIKRGVLRMFCSKKPVSMTGMR